MKKGVERKQERFGAVQAENVVRCDRNRNRAIFNYGAFGNFVVTAVVDVRARARVPPLSEPSQWHEQQGGAEQVWPVELEIPRSHRDVRSADPQFIGPGAATLCCEDSCRGYSHVG